MKAKNTTTPAPVVVSEAKSFGLSEQYWSRLSDAGREHYRLVRPLRRSVYKVNVFIEHLQEWIDRQTTDAKDNGGVFDLNPDFQRGNVWSTFKQERYMESFLRGCAPTLLRFNAPSYEHVAPTAEGMNPHDMVCIDGLQRITAILHYVQSEIRAFGLLANNFSKGPFTTARYTVEIEVFAIKTRRELLQFYLDLNTGGVVHTDDEIARVRALLEKEPK